ncbi:MAG: LuxR C-terminal-related transcriptional regulator, partial [Burkholderiaceae bacterium]
EDDSDLFLPAIRKVANGGKYISPKVADLLASSLSPDDQHQPHTALSNREYEIFIRIVRGISLTEIAEEFSLSIKTISTHKTHILSKMGFTSHVDLVRYAIEHKLLDLAKE